MDARGPQREPGPGSLRPLYWALACEPLVLAAIAYYVRLRGAVSPASGAVPGILAGVFALASLGLVYISFGFAAGRYDPKDARSPLPQLPGRSRLASVRILAIGLAAAPGILGLVLCLLTGSLWLLAAFNGVAFLAAAMHALAFSEQR